MAIPFYSGTSNFSGDINGRAAGFYLRIMPLGASITKGNQGSPGVNDNGYRKPLRDQLRFDGWQVNMVGTQPAGTMQDNDSEGYPDERIAEIGGHAQFALPVFKPNVTLINAGTNDATQDYYVNTAGQRMNDMIMDCFIRVPGTVVILSTLLPNSLAPGKVAEINDQYRNLAAKLRKDRFPIILAEMDDGFITIDEIWDGTHPNLSGYQKMAAVWHHAINQADKNGWFRQPSSDVTSQDGTYGNTCPKVLGSGSTDPRSGMQILTANTGLIYDYGKYMHSSTAIGVIHTHNESIRNGRPGGERDDIVYVDGSALKITLFITNGDGTFGPAVKIGVYDSCPLAGVHWGDVNNDGLDDFICIGEAGNIDVWCWRNGGLGNKAEYWQSLGKVFTGKRVDGETGRFVDINGDGRSDWLLVNKYGQVVTYINQRGDGDGLAPKWLKAGMTHTETQGDDVLDENILFGQVYGERADYVLVEQVHPILPMFKHLKCWKNFGGGGKHQKGDGAQWGDMDGNGNDDYVWISPDGKVAIFRNLHQPPDTSKFKTGGGWDAAHVNLETGYDRRALHIGDWDGDGKADIIAVEKGNGAVTVWKTSYAGNKFLFTKQVIPNSGKCNQGWDVGLFDIGVIFADLTGNGRVDYLCMQPDRRTEAWLNDDGSDLRSVGQVKFSEKLDRANHRFADVNGGGRADFLWVDKFNGYAKVWENLGEVPNGGHVEGGGGRADIVDVNPTTAKGFIWFNSCPGGGDDGEGPVADPMLPVYNLSGPIDPTDADDKVNADKFCSKNEGDWTPDLWNELGVGKWLDQKSRWYSGRPEGWPIPTPNPERAGVPRVIARFELLTEDGNYNWPPHCTDILQSCIITPVTDFETKCPNDWERAYSLFAMANFARFIQRFVAVFKSEADSTAYDLSTMTDNFIASQSKGLAISDGAWLTMAGGAVTAVTAFIPGFAGMAGAAASGIFGIASTMADGATEIKDPRFTSFFHLLKKFGDMRDLVIHTADNYFQKMLHVHPATRNIEQGTQLSNILKSSIYSNQYIGMGGTNTDIRDPTPGYVEFDGKLMRKMIKAPLISEIWNSQRIFIAKFPKGLRDYTWDGAIIYRNFKLDPCYGTVNYEETFDGKYYCPHGEGGLGENNYLLLSWDIFRDNMFNDYGTAQKKLEEVGMDKSEMVISAVRVQEAAKEFIPRRTSVISDMFLEIANNPDGAAHSSHPLFVNIPVCDLTHLDLKWDNDVCFIFQSIDGTRSEKSMYLDCLSHVLRESCSTYKVDGHSWPYDKKAYGFKTIADDD
ncbi:hypothetical protein VE02_08782 [Pseudogymnoascus sp. 03VT05]|nr:hypothetical protein VE02_08782 [Pseudogymnoascus sp. 03VT05]